jgi:excisionase family DNA binding protein
LAALNGLGQPSRDETWTPAHDPGVRLIGEEGVARCLSLSPRTVRRLLVSGALPSVLIGRARRVLVSDLDAYIASLKGAATG